MHEIKQTVRDFVVDNYLFGNEENAPGPHTSFLEQRLMDSTGVLELVFFLEETFDITISDEELVLDNLDSLAQINAFVTRKTGRG